MNEKVCLTIKDVIRICELLVVAEFEDRIDEREARQFINAIYKEAWNQVSKK